MRLVRVRVRVRLGVGVGLGLGLGLGAHAAVEVRLRRELIDGLTRGAQQDDGPRSGQRLRRELVSE